jgi:bifunctional non-homologous end joining protein LigD
LKHKDRFANGGDVLSLSHSVLSGSTLDALDSGAKPERIDAGRLAPIGPSEPMPKKLAPMLAEQGDGAQTDSKYLYEPKIDGYRVISYIESGKVRLISRRGIELTRFFPEIVEELSAQAVDSMVLDGEIVALGADGRPSFNALQNRAQAKGAAELVEAQRAAPVVFVCFDLLHFAGLNLRDAPYIDRHRYLAQCLLPSKHIQLVHVSHDAEQLYAASLASGFEGIVAKRKDAPYQPGKRSPAWRKVKAIETNEFVVGGYTKGRGARESLGAFLLGYWSGKELHYAGHVGSGLTEGLVNVFRKRFEALERKDSPFVEKPPLHRPTTWLDPKLVIEVSFVGWTPDQYLRAPVFLRERTDIEPRTITAKKVKVGSTPKLVEAAAKPGRPTPTPADEIGSILAQLKGDAKQLTLTVGKETLRLSNLDRVYWPADPRFKQPAITKRDFIRYLAVASPFMLPHLKDRPLTMIRMPEGIDGERFYQKHWEQSSPDFVQKVTVFSEHRDLSHDYILANNLPTLLWLGQNGTLEFHVWHSRTAVEPDAVSQSTDFAGTLESLEKSVLNYPDFLVFDIDPYIYSGQEAKGAEPELNKKGFTVGRKVAFWLRDLLRAMSLDAVVKTSGKTGLHVFVPIERTVNFDEARRICEMVGRHLVREHPRDITMEWATIKRTGKIFIDYNMNVRGKTLNVAYSPRGVPGAPVSMPLTWEELEAAEPLDFRVGNVLGRLEKGRDRWHDLFQTKQSLTRAFDSAGRRPTQP